MGRLINDNKLYNIPLINILEMYRIRKAHSRPFSRDKRWRKAYSVLAREETVDRDLERRVAVASLSHKKHLARMPKH